MHSSYQTVLILYVSYFLQFLLSTPSLELLGIHFFALPSKTRVNSCQHFCLHSLSTGAWLGIPKIWLLEWWNADSYSCSYWENQSALAAKAYYNLHQLLLALLCFPISDFWFCSQHPLLPEEHTSPYCSHASIPHQPSLLNSTSTHLIFTFQFLELSPIPSSL